ERRENGQGRAVGCQLRVRPEAAGDRERRTRLRRGGEPEEELRCVAVANSVERTLLSPWERWVELDRADDARRHRDHTSVEVAVVDAGSSLGPVDAVNC